MVTESDEAAVLWDISIQTDKEIKTNRADLSAYRHLSSLKEISLKVIEKLSKYEHKRKEKWRRCGT